VSLLAVSIDDEESRTKIPAFLKRHNLHCRVLLGDSEHPEGYDTETAGTLYIVDHNGLLAGVPGEFEPHFEKQAARRIEQLLTPDSQPGPLLLEIEKPPPGFEVLWKKPVEGTVTSLAVAPAAGEHAAEIGALDEARLRRYSSTGEPLGEAKADHKTFVGMEGLDLDGDGKSEWMIWGPQWLTLIDSSGGRYWGVSSLYEDKLQYLGVRRPLDGDDLSVVLRDGDWVYARGVLPGTLWTSPPLGRVKSVVLDRHGDLLVQTDETIRMLDGAGRFTGPVQKAPSGALLAGRISDAGHQAWDLFTYASGPKIQTLDRFTSEGPEQILMAEGGRLSVYTADARPMLILKLLDDSDPIFAAGDLDGKPGDEIVLYIPRYGLVALGNRSRH
jgi:hypothetical protein